MGRFLLREFLRFALLMGAVSLVTFALVAASPIDPVQANVGQQALIGMSGAKRDALAAHWGADASLFECYGAWLTGVLHGDWGISLRFNAPVVQVLASRAGGSLALMVTAWVLSGVFGLVLGTIAGLRRGSVFDRTIRACCIALSSTPAFWVGLVALMVFSVALGWFPIGFSQPIGIAAGTVRLGDRIHHLILPALVLSITSLPAIALHTREKVIEVMASDYVRFARARGESACSVVFRHGMRNLLLPVISLQMASIGEVLGGSVLVEQVFSYPGLGQAVVAAGLGGDAPLLVAIALASAALVFCGNLVADLLYRAIDPRQRRTGALDDGWQ